MSFEQGATGIFNLVSSLEFRRRPQRTGSEFSSHRGRGGGGGGARCLFFLVCGLVQHTVTAKNFGLTVFSDFKLRRQNFWAIARFDVFFLTFRTKRKLATGNTKVIVTHDPSSM